MKEKVNLIYYDSSSIQECYYWDFLQKVYNDKAFYRYNIRGNWYKKALDYKILLAIIDGIVVGQSCAYKTCVIVHGREIVFWWGIDSYVLSDFRGYGIGQMLQKKLFEDCPNFSSLYYSKTNGYIKFKLGAINLFKIKMTYYPVSSFMSVLLKLIIRKLFHCDLGLTIRIPYFYTYLNCPFSKKIEYEVLSVDNFYDFTPFINNVLKSYDFYIKRDYSYFNWKYFNNPCLRFVALRIKGDLDQTIAIVLFTEPFDATCIMVPIRGVKILDTFISKNAHITEKNIIYLISTYYKSRGEKIDMIISLLDSTYWPKFSYPQLSLLSTLSVLPISNPYISLIDQDMDQIF